MNGRSPVAVVRRRRWTALAAFVLTLVATGLWLALAPRTYTATATVSAAAQPGLVGSPATARDLRATVAELADSTPVLEQVVGKLKAHRTVAELRDEVRGRAEPGTVLIRICVHDKNADVAANAANAVTGLLAEHDPSGGQLIFADAQPATVPSGFSSPDVLGTVLVGLGLAVLVALAAAFVHEAASGAVDEAAQLATVTRVPVLAALTRPADPASVPVEKREDGIDDFRALRVALEFASSAEPTPTVVLSSLTRDEAGGWLAVNLAAALAQVARRVLVIDADFAAETRHPILRSRGNGLAEVLRGTIALRDAVRPSALAGISILPVGTLGTDCSADLVEVGFHRAVAEIAHEVDLVIVNAGPLAESLEPQVMAAGNALVLTVPAGQVRARELRQVLAGLAARRLRVIGTVLLTSARSREGDRAATR